VDVKDLQKLFERARDLTNHAEFVVVGSNSVLGVPFDGELPPRMTMSIDVDAYTKNDPGRIFDVEKQLGQGSPFELENGYYLDPVSPSLPTLPDGWESRLFKVKFDSGLVVHFLDPNDAAVSKYARCEPRDREWLQAGLDAGVLSGALIEYRMRETSFADDGERARAVAAFEEDSRRRRPTPGVPYRAFSPAGSGSPPGRGAPGCPGARGRRRGAPRSPAPDSPRWKPCAARL
jgi:hypothetical protein